MAIDLPPVIPPQKSTVQRIVQYLPAGSEIVHTENQGTVVQVSGNRYLNAEQIKEIFSQAASPSDAIRNLNRAYYNAGHLLVTIYYAADKDQGRSKIYVHVINGKLDQISAPDGIAKYFKPLVGDDNLTVAEFDRRRVLADLRAKRAGLDYKVTYKLEGDPQAYTMVFTPQSVIGYDHTDVTFQLGNQGNRFVGRYFGSVGWTERFTNGVELKLGGDLALPDLGEARGGDEYIGTQFRLNYPSTFGLYGVEVSRVTYERTLFLNDPVAIPQDPLVINPIPPLTDFIVIPQDPLLVEMIDLTSQSVDVALTGEQILFTSSKHRLSALERIEHVNAEIDTVDFGNLQDEVYTSVELGLKYTRRISFFGKSGRLAGQGFVKGGVTGDEGTFGTDTRPEAVGIGKRTSEYLVVRPKLALRLDLASWVNWQMDLIGQWSDGAQVPQKQQFVLGGMNTLSAWLPGILVGDTGVFTRLKFETAEWQWIGGKHTFGVFAEYGQVEYEDVTGPLAESRSLSDGGFNYTVKWPWDVEMTLVAAANISDDGFDEATLDAASADFFWRMKKVF